MTSSSRLSGQYYILAKEAQLLRRLKSHDLDLTFFLRLLAIFIHPFPFSHLNTSRMFTCYFCILRNSYWISETNRALFSLKLKVLKILSKAKHIFCKHTALSLLFHFDGCVFLFVSPLFNLSRNYTELGLFFGCLYFQKVLTAALLCKTPTPFFSVCCCSVIGII